MRKFELPRLSGDIETGIIEQFFIDFPVANYVKNIFWNSGKFIIENAATILGIFIIIGISIILFRKLKAQQRHVKKLWKYNLFFLSKRQMMIPLVFTLADRDEGLVDKKAMQNLLKIRNECRDISLKNNPQERLLKEKEISLAFLEYFEKCEKSGRIEKNPKFKRIVSDLEFIDEKLIQLQKIYNAETTKWNKLVEFTGIKFFFHILGFRGFRCFDL